MGPWELRCLSLLLLAWPAMGGLPVSLRYIVAEKFPHQVECFTEGLFVNDTRHEAYESCGLYGRSYLRKYQLKTGETLKTARVPSSVFSEGLALMGDRLFMLTYHGHKVLEFDVNTFQLAERTHPFPYGEGWGLATNGCDLYATTGSSFLFRLRIGQSGVLELVDKVQVTYEGRPMVMLNELEFVTPKLWINQWHTNNILRVDPTTGIVEARIDVRGLHRWSGEQTPNGIAYSKALGFEYLLVTGKQWPHMFSLQMTAEDLCGGPLSTAPTCPTANPSICWPGPIVEQVGKSLSLVEKPASGAGQLAATPLPELPQLPQTAMGQSMPGSVVAVSLVLAAFAGLGTIVAPICIHARRSRYRLAMQKAETEGSS